MRPVAVCLCWCRNPSDRAQNAAECTPAREAALSKQTQRRGTMLAGSKRAREEVVILPDDLEKPALIVDPLIFKHRAVLRQTRARLALQVRAGWPRGLRVVATCVRKRFGVLDTLLYACAASLHVTLLPLSCFRPHTFPPATSLPSLLLSAERCL